MTKRTSSRGEYKNSILTKEAISSACLSLIDQTGISGISVQAVSQRSGIPISSINYQFPTKSALLRAALQERDKQHAQELRARWESVPLELADLVRNIAQSDEIELNRLKLDHHLRGEAVETSHPAHNYFKHRHQSSIEIIAGLVRELQNQGKAHGDLDPKLTATQILAAWIGLESIWLIDSSFNFSEAVRQIVRQLTRQEAVEAKQAIAELAASI